MTPDEKRRPNSLDELFRAPADDRRSPFGDDAEGATPADRFQSALTRLRRLRAQVGAEGLSSAGTRSLLDEVVKALEALEEMGGGRGP